MQICINFFHIKNSSSHDSDKVPIDESALLFHKTSKKAKDLISPTSSKTPAAEQEKQRVL